MPSGMETPDQPGVPSAMLADQRKQLRDDAKTVRQERKKNGWQGQTRTEVQRLDRTITSVQSVAYPDHHGRLSVRPVVLFGHPFVVLFASGTISQLAVRGVLAGPELRELLLVSSCSADANGVTNSHPLSHTASAPHLRSSRSHSHHALLIFI